ncbi:hypothetical protein [Butyrivibrio sp. AE3006]|uniref:hypothetical protein n=1 Tax=Butyrivibrio sp. AE3006 TaxID=1280673 RepID=UPI0012DF6C39|nr:hypothetical protein [Butyrivibrio sp. AE3006]
MKNNKTALLRRITLEEAQKAVRSMNLINGFLFDSVMEDNERAKTVAGIILSTVLGQEISDIEVTPQKTFLGIDWGLHGIRFDAQIKPVPESSDLSVTIYDLEIEDRESDRLSLPRRQRYYSALSDERTLPSSTDYRELPDYVSVTILSYDPFLAGDMYYAAKMHLKTHPHIEYEDGRLNIFLYAYGSNNVITKDQTYGKDLEEMLKYIVDGTLPSDHNERVISLDNIVSEVKNRSEVSSHYMKAWDREIVMKREWQAEVRAKVLKENAEKFVSYAVKHNDSPDSIKEELMENYDYSEEEADALITSKMAAK